MFNTPLAGAMFALEILLAEFSLLQFGSVVVASVSASLVGHAFFGKAPVLAHPPSAFPQSWELPAYALLGVAAAFVGVGFTRLLHGVDDAFNDVFSGTPVPPYLRPAVGGLFVGLAGLWFPQVLGVGFDTVEAVLFNRLAWGSIVLLGLLKLAATSITIGSGGSGGIFGPSIYLGAVLGGLVHHLVHQAMPALPDTPTYAVVGMSAVLAAASQAPITAILALFEMTHDYNAILPLMLATVISAIVARRLLADSIYTLKLTRRGIDIAACRDLNPMSSILVQEAMTPIEAMATVTPDTPLPTLSAVFAETHHHGLAVVDGNDRLVGVVTVSDLGKAQARQRIDGSVRHICTDRVRTVYPDQTLADALRHFGAMDVGRLPVVSRGGGNQVVGMLRRGDIIRAYSRACISNHGLIDRMDQARLGRQAGVHVFRFTLSDTDQAVGRSLEELSLPPGCLVASIRRGDRVVVPHGDTRLAAGDEIVAVMSHDGEHRLRTCLRGHEEAPS
jgi:CIC family chloride channel protein